jgi:hypothetical protein
MRTLLYISVAVMFFALTQSSEADRYNQIVSGQVAFAVDYKPSVMEAKGYKFFTKGTYGEFMTNYFGAPGVDIIVKNAKGEIIGVGKTKSDGTFALSVASSKFYQIAVEFRARKIEKTISNNEASKTIQIDLGRFDSRHFPEIEGHD